MHADEPKRIRGVLDHIVSNARAIIAFEIGLPQGCVRMEKLVSRLHPYDGFHYPVFQEYMREVAGLPIGQDRLQWNLSKLAPYDQKLRVINDKYQHAIEYACWAIIAEYSEDNQTNKTLAQP